MQELKGKTAVVTGAASGIGLGLAQRFGEEGMNVVLGDMNADALETAAKELEAAGANVAWLATDVTDDAALIALADLAYERFGGVDVLCPNAGIVGPLVGAAWETPHEDWLRVFGANVFGVASTLRAFIPRMLEADREGHVVFTASIRGLMVGSGAPTYQGSKHAVLSLAEVLRRHLDERDAKVSVSALLAGPVFTSMVPNEIAYLQGRGREVVLPNRDRSGADSEIKPIQPAEIAAAAVDAIRNNTFHVFTHAGSKESVMTWLDPILAALH